MDTSLEDDHGKGMVDVSSADSSAHPSVDEHEAPGPTAAKAASSSDAAATLIEATAAGEYVTSGAAGASASVSTSPTREGDAHPPRGSDKNDNGEAGQIDVDGEKTVRVTTTQEVGANGLSGNEGERQTGTADGLQQQSAIVLNRPAEPSPASSSVIEVFSTSAMESPGQREAETNGTEAPESHRKTPPGSSPDSDTESASHSPVPTLAPRPNAALASASTPSSLQALISASGPITAGTPTASDVGTGSDLRCIGEGTGIGMGTDRGTALDTESAMMGVDAGGVASSGHGDGVAAGVGGGKSAPAAGGSSLGKLPGISLSWG